MLDIFDAAFHYGHNNHVYFFRGRHYIKYKPGAGVVRGDTGILRTIGVDGWHFPPELRDGIDAAMYYPTDGQWFAYFFKGPHYVKWHPTTGVVDGPALRTLGETGWKSLPADFCRGVDAAFYYHDNQSAYFFKGSRYVEYRPGTGVEGGVRTIGVSGWQGLPTAFCQRVDAVLDYSAQELDGEVADQRATYFFHDREYVRWIPNQGVAARYPRRIGLLHRAHGGWPGTSHLLAGPMVGPVEPHRARLWTWLSSADDVEHVRVVVGDGNTPAAVTVRDPTGPVAGIGIRAIQAGSVVRVFELKDLAPATAYRARLLHDTTVLDQVSFTTAPRAAAAGRVRIAFGSCARVNGDHPDVPAFAAMAAAQPDLAIMCGDLGYYVNPDGDTEQHVLHDCNSLERMFTRQLEIRNHPQMATLSRTVPMVATWDDHDFGYNNCHGGSDRDLRARSAPVFQAMWPMLDRADNGDPAIYRSLRWGPVEVFLTDNRFHKAASGTDHEVIWGEAQVRWLCDGLDASTAPVRIVVVGTQFLACTSEGHAREARAEHTAFLDRFRDTRRPIVLLTGDVHYSELFRLRHAGPSWLIEQTSSPLRVNGDPPSVHGVKAGTTRLWGHRGEGFGLVTIAIDGATADGRVVGQITHQAFDQAGVMQEQTTWDTALGV